MKCYSVEGVLLSDTELPKDSTQDLIGGDFAGDAAQVMQRLPDVDGDEVGLFAAITGITGQLVVLYYAFSAIESAGDISPAMVIGGIKVSMITTLYGILIFFFSLLLWFVASQLVERMER